MAENNLGHVSLEVRAKHIKHLGNLELELLKRFYERQIVGEQYRDCRLDIHVHGFVGRRAACLVITAVEGHSRSPEANVAPVLVRIGEVSEEGNPVASVVWLQGLNRCLVGGRKTLEIVPTSDESLRLIFNRKLRALLNLSRIKDGKFVDQVVQGSAQVIQDFPDAQSGGDGQSVSTVIYDCSGRVLRVEAPFRWRYVGLLNRKFVFQPRQILLCPTYSRIGPVDRWLDAIGITHALDSTGRIASQS